MIKNHSSGTEAISTSTTIDESPRSRSNSAHVEFPSGAAVNGPGAQPGRPRYKLVERSPWELDPHPILVKHHIRPSATRLSAIAKSWDPFNLDPIFITRERKILKGLEECEFARLKKIEKVSCLEYDLDEEEQIRWILEHNRKTECLNDFVRIVLALELKPLLLERARKHMQIGGQSKGSMNLPEAESIDCREKIADSADVADVQVSKVEELLQRGNSELLKALRNEEVRIYRASVWVKNPEHLSDQLLLHRTLRGTTREVNRHLDIRRIGNALAAMDSARRANVVVAPIRAPGQVLLFSEQLLQNLETQGELNL
jgi:hypothetical protein